MTEQKQSTQFTPCSQDESSCGDIGQVEECTDDGLCIWPPGAALRMYCSHFQRVRLPAQCTLVSSLASSHISHQHEGVMFLSC